MKKLTNYLKKNKEWLLPSSVYLTATGIDYLITSSGIGNPEFKELNPLINYYLPKFGGNGILIHKLIIGGVVVATSKYSQNKLLFNKINFNKLLYPLSALTAGIPIGSLLIAKYFS